MDGFFRKARGLLGVGVTWGAVWAAIGAGVGALMGMASPEIWTWSNPIAEWAFGIGVYGFVSGVGFGALLSLREGAKTLRELSLSRAAIWGGLGAVAVPLLFGALGTFGAGTTLMDVFGAMLVTAALGAMSAPASISIARRAELSPAEEATLLSSQ
jgi:hypothetical protein